jgi:hypothetical protein
MNIKSLLLSNDDDTTTVALNILDTGIQKYFNNNVYTCVSVLMFSKIKHLRLFNCYIVTDKGLISSYNYINKKEIYSCLLVQ